MAFDHKSPVNQISSVQLWESYPKTRDVGLIRPWVSIKEGGPEILKHDVARRTLMYLYMDQMARLTTRLWQSSLSGIHELV